MTVDFIRYIVNCYRINITIIVVEISMRQLLYTEWDAYNYRWLNYVRLGFIFETKCVLHGWKKYVIRQFQFKPHESAVALALFDVARLDIGRETRIYLQQLLIRRALSCFHFHFPFFIASILILAQLFRFFLSQNTRTQN